MYVLFSLVQRGITVLPLFLSLSRLLFSRCFISTILPPPLAPVLGRNGMEKCFRTVVECIAEFFSARVYIRGTRPVDFSAVGSLDEDYARS